PILSANNGSFTFALAANPGSPTGFGTAALSLAGKTIRIRIASAANQGPLLLGVDNVRLNVKFADTTPPTLTNLAVNNPSFFLMQNINGVNVNVPYTNDPTITGTIGSIFGLNDVAGLKGAIASV